MNNPALRVVPAFTDDEAQRAARAGAAMLLLQLRSALAEAEDAERAERAAAEAATTAPAELRVELDAAIARRRHHHDTELEAARLQAARRILDARTEARAAIAAAAAAAAATAAVAAAAVVDEVEPVEEVEDVPEVAEVAEAAEPAEEPRLDEPSVEEPPAPPAAPEVAPPPVAAPVAAVAPEPVAWVPQPSQLAELVQAAVSATLSEVLGRSSLAVATGTPLPVAAAPPALEPPDEESFWRRLRHLDVALPLLAVALVFIVLVAWVG